VGKAAVFDMGTKSRRDVKSLPRRDATRLLPCRDLTETPPLWAGQLPNVRLIIALEFDWILTSRPASFFGNARLPASIPSERYINDAIFKRAVISEIVLDLSRFCPVPDRFATPAAMGCRCDSPGWPVGQDRSRRRASGVNLCRAAEQPLHDNGRS